MRGAKFHKIRFESFKMGMAIINREYANAIDFLRTSFKPVTITYWF